MTHTALHCWCGNSLSIPIVKSTGLYGYGVRLGTIACVLFAVWHGIRVKVFMLFCVPELAQLNH